MCVFSCVTTKNECWPHYEYSGGACTGGVFVNNHFNKSERNTNCNGVCIERRDQYKSGRPLSHSLGAPSSLIAESINLSDSVPNLCADDNNAIDKTSSTYYNGQTHIKLNVKLNANKSTDAFSAGRVSHVYVDAINSASVAGENARNKLLWAKPPISDNAVTASIAKTSRLFFGVSLDEREMPITRERQTKLLPTVTKRDMNGRKANKSNGVVTVQSANKGNTKYDLLVERPRNR